MTTATFKQTKKVGVAGSFINQMMGNNTSRPEVGKGATLLHYTDRSVCEVVEVSEDGMTAKLETLQAVHDKNLPGGIGHQNWTFEQTGHFFEVVYRKNAWYSVGREIYFTKEIINEAEEAGFFSPCLYLKKNNPEVFEKIYEGNTWPQNAVEGFTKSRVKYNKREILFGAKDYHYDWSF